MDIDCIKKELSYKAVRSSGPGGQNVNKVSSKVIIEFSIENSNCFSAEQKEILLEKLLNKISSDGLLIVSSSETRSQVKNKEIAFNKLILLLQNSLKVKAKRIATKIPKAVVKRRLENKKVQSLKKNMRKNINL
jgi:ribosome-associated protein